MRFELKKKLSWIFYAYALLDSKNFTTEQLIETRDLVIVLDGC